MGKNNKKIKLILFLTSKSSIARWNELGTLNRELYLYKKIYHKNIETEVVSYGGNRDYNLRKKIKPIIAHSLLWEDDEQKLLENLVKKYKNVFTKADLFKTNQVKGSEIALKIGNYFKKPVIVRAGYLPSRHPKPGDESTIKKAEKYNFAKSTICFVTTEDNKKYLIKKYNIVKGKIFVVPNYVDYSIFKPIKVNKNYDISYVGRGSEEKNVMLILNTLLSLKKEGLSLRVLMIGSCSRKDTLRDFSKRNKLDVEWMGSIPNEKLPYYLNQSKIFILPSRYEGHPKALLEAMSCGLACIGTNVEGIRNVIKNMDNGLLSKSNIKDLSHNIKLLISNKKLRKTIGKKAREYVKINFSFKDLTKKEMGLYYHALKLAQ